MNWRKVEVQNSESQLKTLVGDVRSAANKSMEALWNAFMEVGDPDMLRATERALLLMVSHSDYAGAMKVLEGIYALVEIAPPEDITDCQQYPALAQMFMEEFLAGSEDFIFDAGMENVLAFLTDKGQ